MKRKAKTDENSPGAGADEASQTFAEQLRRAREAAGYSMADLARLSGVSPTSLSRYETTDPAKRRLPSGPVLSLLARVLGVSRATLETPDVLPRARTHLACRAKHAGWLPAQVAATAVIAGTPRVGEGTTIGHFVLLDALHDSIEVGNNCKIEHGAHLLTRVVGKYGNVLTGPVTCGNNVTIGSHAVLLPGSELADDAVVLPGVICGMGSLLDDPRPGPGA